MFYKKPTILLSVFISISVNSVHALVSDDCMKTYDWESKNQLKEEKKIAGECLYNEQLKRGYKPCNYKCLEKLSLEKQKKRISQDIEQVGKLISEEMARRKNLD